MKIFLYISFLLLPSGLFSQSFKQFKKLSRPEKRWVCFHPFIAKKAFAETRLVWAVVDSVKQTGIIGSDLNGGKLDAFKHSYWMASLYKKIGRKKALKLGKAHEKGNYLQFKKHQLEDAILPDAASSEMDLYNNEAGVNVFGKCRSYDRKEVQALILAAIEKGEMRIIKKDAAGNYLDCDGKPIDMNVWKGKWNIPKCVIASDL